jgi:hypothetical protein
MAPAAAQEFREGQKAVEKAPAQGEREAFEQHPLIRGMDFTRAATHPAFYASPYVGGAFDGWLAGRATRPAQPEQQPIAHVSEETFSSDGTSDIITCNLPIGMALYAAHIAQTATQGKFRMGDLVKKSSGSEWEGRVVGWYSTEQTPEGYAVESGAHRNSVQIYPAKALELLPMAAKEA